MLMTVLAAASTRAASDDYKSTPEYRALSENFRVTSVVTADLDEDRVDEVAVAYRTSSSSATPEGGLLVLKPTGGAWRPVFHVFFDSTYASELAGQKGQLELTLVRSSAAGDEERLLEWKYGEQFVFNGHERSALRNLKASATTTMKGGSAYASNAIDNDLDTAWAEGVGGTGVGESITLKLARPIGVGLLGMFPGKNTDDKAFKRANRVHRATLEIQTESDVGDEASALDFSDLGIDIAGDTEELAFENKPEFRYFKLKRRKALNLIIKLDSVYLGDKEDDTYIAEIEIVPLLPRTETLDKAKKKPAKSGAAPSVKGAVVND
ncbi:MAG: hypothetical protein ABIJ09_09085 [Pseudomonadota bacterium]